jgi:heterodisulfide reductase subunit A
MKTQISPQVPAGEARCGVFLCECGPQIAPRVDLKALAKLLDDAAVADHLEVLPFPCLRPGLERVKEAVVEKGLNRVVVAGCERRIMLKKFETALQEVGLMQGLVDMVNLRDHVAQVQTGAPAPLARHGAKLIKASLAGLRAIATPTELKVDFREPIMILGGGIATYGAAQELLRRGVKTIVAIPGKDFEEEIRRLHDRYPGERHYHERLRQLMREVYGSPLVQKIIGGTVEKVLGRVGEYHVTISFADQPPQEYQVGTIIAALDGETYESPEFWHDGGRILSQRELEESLWLQGLPQHRVVFWINDLEMGQPCGQLSARAAWHTATHILEKSPQAQVAILYNQQIPLPLSTSERVWGRQLGLALVPYDGSVRPVVQSGYITYSRPEDQIEHELAWDQLVLSPRWRIGAAVARTAQILGKEVVEGAFLERHPQVVMPHEVALDEKLPIVGSARQPCGLEESLRQGRQAAKKKAALLEKARAGQLKAVLNVCQVDPEVCTSCGLCREICDCGAIEPVEGLGGSTPRVVDPLVCTGCATCAASCPNLAITSQIYNTARYEATVAALARELEEEEILGFGCQWSGIPAADNAGLHGLRGNSGFYLLPLQCIGQLDPMVMGRAFLEGANSLLLIGCRPEECHHSYGLDHCWGRVLLLKKLLSMCGLERERIVLAHSDLTKPEQYLQTVRSFRATMDRLGPIQRDAATLEMLRALYDTLHRERVRWALGVSLRLPYERTYPSQMPNPIAYDKVLTDIVTEDFLQARITNLLKKKPRKSLQLHDIAQVLEVDQELAHDCLKEMGREGLISIVLINRIPYYGLQQ